MEEANFFCIKFDLGLPLEDIFPPNAIHPRLHKLLCQATIALKNSSQYLDDVLDNCDVSESTELENDLVKGDLSQKNHPPSSLFWLIRHFLALLPLPLFPTYTNNEFYNWKFLSKKCALSHLQSDSSLEAEISYWIHQLPKPNVVLIYALMMFFRRNCLRRYSKKLDWYNVRAVTVYFTSALFFRPFGPKTRDVVYYPFLCYLILYWSKIMRLKDEEFAKLEDKVLVKEREYKIEIIEEGEEMTDRSCQTSSLLNKTKGKSVCTSTTCLDKIEETAIDKGKLKEEVGEDKKKEEQIQQEEQKEEEQICEESTSKIYSEPAYEDISEEKISNIDSNSETMIFKDQRTSTPKALKQTIAKANKSLVSVISKMNEKLKSKQEQLRSKSSSRVENCKYNLLEESNVAKVQSLPANHSVRESPNIKYEKLAL